MVTLYYAHKETPNTAESMDVLLENIEEVMSNFTSSELIFLGYV